MNNGSENRNEVLICDLYEAVREKYALSLEKHERFRWRCETYETNTISGRMVLATPLCEAPALTVEVRLTGWYAIYLGMYDNPYAGNSPSGSTTVTMVKLTDDEQYQEVAPLKELGYNTEGIFCLDESFWKAADMTGQSVLLRHPFTKSGFPPSSAMAFIRFIPLSGEQVASIQADRRDQSTRRVHCSNDMHSNLCLKSPENMEDLLCELECFRYSDVGAVDLEYHGAQRYAGRDDLFQEHYNERRFDDNFYDSQRNFYKNNVDCLEEMIRYSHHIGLKANCAVRAGNWCCELPLETGTAPFFLQNQRLWCKDRDGTPVSRFSYANGEATDYIIQAFRQTAHYSCDGLTLYFHRGAPFILFEDAFAKKFEAVYGMKPYTLPLRDERVIKLKCKCMTEFLRKLRGALDESCALLHRERLELNVHVFQSPAASRYVGLDVAEWVALRLVDSVVSYPLEHYENLPDDVYTDETHSQIDIGRYSDFIKNSPQTISPRREGYCGPFRATNGDHELEHADYLSEWAEIFKGTNIPFYLTLMPHQMDHEAYFERAKNVFDHGIFGVSLWDVNARTPVLHRWNAAARLGHTLRDDRYGLGGLAMHRAHKLLKLGAHRLDRYPPSWGG